MPGKQTQLIFLLGDSFVGKTAMLNSLQGKSIETTITLGLNKVNLTFPVNDKQIIFTIFDFGGNEKFHKFYLDVVKTVDGGFFVFDLTSRRSFANISYYFELLQKVLLGKPVILLGNKSDLERVISKEEVFNFTRQHNLPYFETSAVTKENLTEAFITLGRLLLEKK